VRYTIAVDFDGVINSYASSWTGARSFPDPPVRGAIEWLHKMVQKFDVIILSTRARHFGAKRAMRLWLRRHAGNLYWETPGFVGIESVRITDRKPPALVYIDDRAWRFDGEGFPSADLIHRLRPWNKPANPASAEETNG
jgi:hypothetical protein